MYIFICMCIFSVYLEYVYSYIYVNKLQKHTNKYITNLFYTRKSMKFSKMANISLEHAIHTTAIYYI